MVMIPDQTKISSKEVSNAGCTFSHAGQKPCVSRFYLSGVNSGFVKLFTCDLQSNSVVTGQTSKCNSLV